MKTIKYIEGDATSPQASGNKIICHICNDVGGWGKGFVLALSKRWNEPEKAYRTWYQRRKENDFSLGSVQFIQVKKDIWVANMIGQKGTKTGSNGPPVRYDAIQKALHCVATKAAELNASAHMPRIGCGLAGGKWDRIEPIIIEKLSKKEIEVTVYDFA